MIIQLPFEGFYNSVHSDILDSEIESIFSDDRGDTLPDYDSLYCSVWDQPGAWSTIALEYSQLYVEALKDELKTEHDISLDSLKFESLTSPREYNFETDRIFCHISQKDVEALRALVTDEQLAAVIAKRCTSRSGFISHYSNDLAEWDSEPLEQWDHNQLNILLSTAFKYVADGIEERWIMEDATCNGSIYNMIEKHVPQSSWDIVNSYHVAA